MKSNSINVAVLMGGISSEREVSLRSGREVSDALQKAGYHVLDIIVDDEEIGVLDINDIDVAFVALHGAFGEDGGVQGVLENKCIPYIGSGIKASRLAMNKIESKKLFDYNGLSTPDYIEAEKLSNDLDLMKFVKLVKLVKSLGMPVVVKPATDGSSIGVQIVKDTSELESALECAGKHGNQIVVEKYIEGREFTVGILIDKPLPIVEIKPESCFYNYCSKYEDHHTEYITSVDLAPDVYKEMQVLALRAHSALGCRDLSRVDIILGANGNPYLLEVNTIPGFTKRSLFPLAAKAAGIEFVQLCDMLVTQAINRKDKLLVSQS
ncbi:MAG: D-alanine--D-alanine ligase [Candidatus Anammoxibacter sp.]